MKKNIILNTFLICAAAFCLTSCSNVDKPSINNSDSTAENIQEGAVSEIPEEDADGNKISVIEVTDAKGIVVTDSSNKPVTELAVVDDKGKIVTDAEGKVSRPNLPAVTASKNNNNSSNNNNNSNNNNTNNNNNNSNNNNNNNNNSTNNNSSGNNQSDNNSGLQKEDDIFAGGSGNYAAFLWFADAKKVNNNLQFSSIKEDSDIIQFTFKVKDTAKSGKYEIRNVSDNDHASTFCNEDVESLDITYCPGTIYVGSDASDTPVDTSGAAFVISSTSAKPGDTVTLTGSVKNIKSNNLNIAAFNSYLSYDHNALEITAITSTDATSTGDFMSNVK